MWIEQAWSHRKRDKMMNMPGIIKQVQSLVPALSIWESFGIFVKNSYSYLTCQNLLMSFFPGEDWEWAFQQNYYYYFLQVLYVIFFPTWKFNKFCSRGRIKRTWWLYLRVKKGKKSMMITRQTVQGSGEMMTQLIENIFGKSYFRGV